MTEGEAARALWTADSGAQPSRARLRGEVVVREGGPWSGSVLALLRHFEGVGFEGAPRVVSSGLDVQGRELLTYLPGSSPHPHAWPNPAMPEVNQDSTEAVTVTGYPLLWAITWRTRSAAWMLDHRRVLERAIG